MNQAELEALLDDHYVSEAQTLTSGAEHNLLKLAGLRGRLTDEQTERWEEVKRAFRKAKSLGGSDEGPVTRVTGQLGLMGDQLGGIAEALKQGLEQKAQRSPSSTGSA